MDNDGTDYLQRYEQFYKDDSFREPYYNYHRQHHNQQELQQSSYNDHHSDSESYNYRKNERYNNHKHEYTDKSYNSYDKKPYGNNHDQQSYGKDYDKSKDNNSVNLKELKCNNIDINVNNADLNFGGPVDGYNIGAEVSAGEDLDVQDTNTVSCNGERSFVDRENDFAFVCINNNNNDEQSNNTPLEPEPEPTPEGECGDAVESCFQRFLSQAQFEEL